MTKQILLTGLGALISLLSLLAPSGIGHNLQLYTYTAILVGGLFLLFPVGRTLGRGYARRREFFLTLGLVLVFLVWPASRNNFKQGLEYGWLLAFAYVFGQLSLSEDDVRGVAFGAGMMGFVVVVARVLLGIFGGWNNNNIAMAGFLGCAVFCAAPWRTWGMKIFQKVLLVMMTLMVLQLDSRSCVTGCLILCVFAFGLVKPHIFVKKPWLRRLALVLPAIIAVGVVLFQNSQMFADLNSWSMEYFGKTIFNGRNTIWEYGFEKLFQNPWMGDAYIDGGYWHNCAITTLEAFGIIGYALWVLYFENIMVDSRRWREDQVLPLCIAAFLTIMLQQSFELGLISTEGSMLPYLILGIMLGRMRHLKEK